MRRAALALGLFALSACKGSASTGKDAAPIVLTGEVVAFPSGDRELHGLLYRPKGPGPFPAVLYNHGSAPGMMSASAAEALGPAFVAKGWVFFMPSRRGQGLSADAGPYIEDARRATASVTSVARSGVPTCWPFWRGTVRTSAGA